jgi:hypothetical protein
MLRLPTAYFAFPKVNPFKAFLFLHVYGNMFILLYSSFFNIISIKNKFTWYFIDISLFVIFYWFFFW